MVTTEKGPGWARRCGGGAPAPGVGTPRRSSTAQVDVDGGALLRRPVDVVLVRGEDPNVGELAALVGAARLASSIGLSAATGSSVTRSRPGRQSRPGPSPYSERRVA